MWNKVEDKLPKENEVCQLRIDYEYPDRMFVRDQIGIYRNGVWECHDLCDEPNMIKVQVTHWKPIEYKEVI